MHAWKNSDFTPSGNRAYLFSSILPTFLCLLEFARSYNGWHCFLFILSFLIRTFLKMKGTVLTFAFISQRLLSALFWGQEKGGPAKTINYVG